MKLGGKKEKAPKIILGAPPIVDLTPPRSREAREKRELKRKWILIVGLVGVVVFAAIAGGVGLRITSKNSYSSEVKAQEKLTLEIAKYKEVDEAISLTRDLETKRQSGFASEVAWQETLDRVQAALPDGVNLVGYTAVTGGNPAKEEGVALAFIARVSSAEPIAYSEVLYVFSGIEGISDVQVGDLSEDAATGRYTYWVAFGVDNSALTRRFVPEAATPAPAPEAEGSK